MSCLMQANLVDYTCSARQIAKQILFFRHDPKLKIPFTHPLLGRLSLAQQAGRPAIEMQDRVRVALQC
jgi:hypothetical protein